ARARQPRAVLDRRWRSRRVRVRTAGSRRQKWATAAGVRRRALGSRVPADALDVFRSWPGSYPASRCPSCPRNRGEDAGKSFRRSHPPLRSKGSTTPVLVSGSDVPLPTPAVANVGTSIRRTGDHIAWSDGGPRIGSMYPQPHVGQRVQIVNGFGAQRVPRVPWWLGGLLIR